MFRQEFRLQELLEIRIVPSFRYTRKEEVTREEGELGGKGGWKKGRVSEERRKRRQKTKRRARACPAWLSVRFA